MVESGSNSAVRRGGRSGHLSSRARRTALTFVTLGLVTFFVPLITVAPPALGRQQWSVLGIALELLARPGTPLPLLRIPFALIYLLLLLATLALCFFPFRKLLLWISVAGLILLYPFRGLFGGFTLTAFFLPSGKGGDFRQLWVALLIVMLVVAFLAWRDTTD